MLTSLDLGRLFSVPAMRLPPRGHGPSVALAKFLLFAGQLIGFAESGKMGRVRRGGLALRCSISEFFLALLDWLLRGLRAGGSVRSSQRDGLAPGRLPAYAVPARRGGQSSPAALRSSSGRSASVCSAACRAACGTALHPISQDGLRGADS